MLITVLTPTFNRGYAIGKLFESLCMQSKKSFEWVIVDDGSTDNTGELVKDFQNRSSFPIRYYFKDNGGKHTAVNFGAKQVKGDYTFIVDSDDRLAPNAIEVIEHYINTVKDNSKFAGVVGLRCNSNNQTWMGFGNAGQHIAVEQQEILEKEYIDATSWEYRNKYKISGDRAEVLKTSILLDHPFPVFEGEKFLSEVALWSLLGDEGYLFRWFNEKIYITEYLADGLSKNIKRYCLLSPKGTAYTANIALKEENLSLGDKLRLCIRYYRYGHLAGYRYMDMFWKCNNKLFSIVCLPCAFFLPLTSQH